MLVEFFPVANLGSQFLRQHAVTFDLANQRMALARQVIGAMGR